MRKILTSFSLVAASLAFAQVGINADQNDIADDAVFHVKNKGSEKKGVILPSVSLAAVDDQTTITGAAGQVTPGLLVWNDGAAGLTPAGYYYWDGAKWALTGNVDAGKTYKNVKLVTSSDASAGTFASSVDSDVIVNTTGALLTIDLTASEIVGNEICVYQKDNGGIRFSSNMKGQATTFTANVGGCFTWDGTHWIGIYNY